MESILVILVFTSAISVILNVFLKKMHIPPIIGYIISGAIISYTFGLDTNKDLIHIAEFGIAFLMFTIGLELSIDKLKSMKKEVFVYGFLQVMVTTVIFSLLAFYLFKFSDKTSIIIGTALALSSTAIVLTILNSNRDITKTYGRKVLGILIFQDLAIIPILLMITIFTNENESIYTLLLTTFVEAIVVVIILYLLGKYVVDKFLGYVIDSKTDEIFVISILFLVLGSALLAHYFGFTYSLGTFIAGVLIAETHFKHKVEADLIPFRDILLGVFFVTVGMQINFATLIDSFFLILGLTISIMLVKALIIFSILVFENSRLAVKSAIALLQVGEFSFAIIELSKSHNLIDDSTTQIIVSATIISMILTPFILRNLKVISTIFISDKEEDIEFQTLDNTNHYIVCGYGRLGKKVVKELIEHKLEYVAIEKDRDFVLKGRKEGVNVRLGNASQKHILEQLHLENSTAVIIAIDNYKKLNLVCETIRSINPNVKIIVHSTDEIATEKLKSIGIEHIIDDTALTAKKMFNLANSTEIDPKKLNSKI